MVQIESTIHNQVPVVSLEERRDTLESRLHTGYEKIEDARKAGHDTTRWEDAWMNLLREYEEVCDQIRRRPALAN